MPQTLSVLVLSLSLLKIEMIAKVHKWYFQNNSGVELYVAEGAEENQWSSTSSWRLAITTIDKHFQQHQRVHKDLLTFEPKRVKSASLLSQKYNPETRSYSVVFETKNLNDLIQVPIFSLCVS